MNPYLPKDAQIIERIQESSRIFSLRLRFTDPSQHRAFDFKPGQFNMLYLYGVGEVAISIVSDPQSAQLYDHTIRPIGRITNGLAKLQPGDHIGVRGPYGCGWPIEQAKGKDVVIITGGLGCAPVVAVIRYIMARRAHYGKVMILQGLKHSDDMIYRERFARWQQMPNTIVHIAADESGPQWPFSTGRVTNFIAKLAINPSQTIAMLCGPEKMMQVAANALIEKQIKADRIYLSMERNMQCGIGHCGHCQIGGLFVCKDGPIFSYAQMQPFMNISGF